MTPNLHPILVHFTIALFSTSFILFLFFYLVKFQNNAFIKISTELEITARWCLWMAALITIFTALAGLYAFNTVRHDTASHIAMTNHRNWAIPTASGIILMSLWSLWDYYKNREPKTLFIIGILITQGLLLSTAWRGGELVYRYGLGVMSLPQSEVAGHHHNQEKAEESNKENIPHSHHEH